MKNLQILYTPDEVHDYLLRQHWQTETFRKAHQEGLDGKPNVIFETVQSVAAYPLIMYNLSDVFFDPIRQTDRIEHSHFTPWWLALGRVEYGSPAMHDLRAIHELRHMARMIHSPNAPLNVWDDKMQANERQASVFSEVLMYLAFPELRPMTFQERIFADRFLEDSTFLRRYREDPAYAAEQVEYARAIARANPNPEDGAELWLNRFVPLHEFWKALWAPYYNQVETKVAELKSAIDQGGDRRALTDAYVAWLQSPEVTVDFAGNPTEVPFYTQAHLYTAQYIAYRNQLLADASKIVGQLSRPMGSGGVGRG